MRWKTCRWYRKRLYLCGEMQKAILPDYVRAGVRYHVNRLGGDNFLTLRSGDSGSSGLLMNFCPFCGGRLVRGAKYPKVKNG